MEAEGKRWFSNSVFCLFCVAYTPSLHKTKTQSQPAKESVPNLLSTLEVDELDIDLIPSAGSRPEIVLRVLNHGERKDFHAQCTLLALRNSPNELYHGTFDLKWEHDFNRSVSLGHEDSSNLMIAKMQVDHRNRLAEMEILGLSGAEAKRFEWSRWSTNLKEKLPEYDLEITVLSDDARSPVSTRFTLRPKAWYGPLEMVRI